MTNIDQLSISTPFNSPVEIGLRALAILNESFPVGYSLQRLIIFDYLVVHSDDIPSGPLGLHPQTPHRGGELLVRRSVLEEGLLLYQSRGLLERRYTSQGMFFAATDRSAAFLDALDSGYLEQLRDTAAWLVSEFGALDDDELNDFTGEHIGDWGAEFAMESVLHIQEGS